MALRFGTTLQICCLCGCTGDVFVFAGDDRWSGERLCVGRTVGRIFCVSVYAWARFPKDFYTPYTDYTALVGERLSRFYDPVWLGRQTNPTAYSDPVRKM